MAVTITRASDEDFEAIWRIFHAVIQGADSYAAAPDASREWARAKWLNPQAETYVLKDDGEVAGVCLLKSNKEDFGSHVANASYIVSPDHRRKSYGRMLGEHVLKRAAERGFMAIQYNFVVSTNTAAVNLWKSLGFTIIGTTPKGFRHGTLGYVDTYIMHRFL